MSFDSADNQKFQPTIDTNDSKTIALKDPKRISALANDKVLTDSKTSTEYAVLIFMLQSLKSGKACSQGAHAIHHMTRNFEKEYQKCIEINATPSAEYFDYAQWCEMETKIVYSATAEQLLHLAMTEKSVAIIDKEGDAFVAPGTLVCVAIIPKLRSECDILSKGYKLF